MIGGIAIVVLAIATMIGYRAADTVPGRQYYNLKAEFTQADNLSNHYEVRIGGLRAGQILNPRVHDGKALVDIRLDKKFAPLRADSKLQVRLRSAVGVRYLQIVPGKRGAPLKEGDLLPTENQTQNVALDQVLGTLDSDTRQKAQTLLDALGEGADGNGLELNTALRKLTPFLRQVQTLARPLNAQPGSTARAIRETDAAVGAFDGVRDTLASAFDPLRRGLKPFADDADRIGETLDEATPTLHQVQAQLPQVDRLVRAVDGLAVDGRPALQQAPSALKETTRLLKGARPAVRQAKATLDLAKGAVDPTINVLQTLQPQLVRIDSPINSARPLLKHLAPHACAIPSVFSTWANWLKWGSDKSSGIRFYIQENLGDTLSGGSATNPVRQVLNQFVHSNPYPEPCDNGNNTATGSSESGPNLPDAIESSKGLTYSKSFPVIR
ncbi:MlaD family protein [Patulibacter sp. NPDC049589]|uniref:MCE family protein n=1 Tax=Patulibacter sp. NPDC049589 TaxID=3154731 RepID=UPI0034247396